MRQPENDLELRTKYSSPVRGSKAGCDSNRSLDTPGGVQGCTLDEAAAATAPSGVRASQKATTRGFMRMGTATLV
ncbi:hypothetical protein GCM10027021_11520 [Dyella kyungheensis]